MAERAVCQMDDQDLKSVVERARSQDPEAFEQIYRRCGSRVLGLCRYLLGRQESAEDAASEVFLKLQHSLESYDRSMPFSNWLLRVAGNVCTDVLRSQQRTQKVMVEEGLALTTAASPEPSPLSAVITSENRERVRDAVARLPENYRVPLVLRYYGELSYEEIARQLGLERSHVAVLIFRAKQELRRKLAGRSK